MRIMLLYIILFIAFPVIAKVDSVKVNDTPQLVKYYFVLLKHGPNRTETDTAKIMQIQAGPMAHITNMAKKGLVMLAGPFGDEKGGGIFILKTETYEEAEKLCNEDPAVKSGRLVAEIREWYTMKGSFAAEKEKREEKHD